MHNNGSITSRLLLLQDKKLINRKVIFSFYSYRNLLMDIIIFILHKEEVNIFKFINYKKNGVPKAAMLTCRTCVRMYIICV
jgi:hypothetical protein